MCASVCVCCVAQVDTTISRECLLIIHFQLSICGLLLFSSFWPWMLHSLLVSLLVSLPRSVSRFSSPPPPLPAPALSSVLPGSGRNCWLSMGCIGTAWIFTGLQCCSLLGFLIEAATNDYFYYRFSLTVISSINSLVYNRKQKMVKIAHYSFPASEVIYNYTQQDLKGQNCCQLMFN